MTGMRSHAVDPLPVAMRDAADGRTVVAARETSVRAGAAMYELGGNAVDAAVAAGLVAGVIEPTETTLAGSGFMLVHSPDGEVHSVDFGPLAPMAVSADMFELDRAATSSNVLGLAAVTGSANVTGRAASGVPRTLLGLLAAQERWGRLPVAAVLEPAIRAAREGFPADTWFVINALPDRRLLAADPMCRAVFLDDSGLPIGADSAAAYGPSVAAPPMVRQPVLAETLETLAVEGAASLIDGGVARRLAATFAEYGMRLHADDLRRAAPTIGSPRRLDYRGGTVWVSDAPGGGHTVLEILALWERVVDRAQLRGLPRAERLLLLSRVLRHAFADRYHWLGDERVVPVPADALLSDGYLADLAARVRREPWRAGASDAPPWIRFAGEALHDPWPYDAAGRRAAWRAAGASEPSSGTTHVSAADRDGWAVSLTHTAANHFGAAVMCPRTGLLFDSAMAWFNAAPGAANSIAPGARPVANMAPALITAPAGVAAVGASGGRRIISAVAQLVMHLLDDGFDPAAALARPRIDGSGTRIVLHAADAAAVSPELDPLIVPQTNAPYELDFARANIAVRASDGRVRSAIDARAYGD